jgi:ATP-dependent Lhr-like helicase
MDLSTPNGIAFADIASPAGALAALPDPTARWFSKRYGVPTAAQRLAWPAVAAGHNLLLSAPTGTGKTLAAFLPILGSMIAETSETRLPWSILARGVSCLYVAPLKALANDALHNLEIVVRELSAPYCGSTPHRLGVRTGDTAGRVRRAQLAHPPDILLTTPETLAVLLSRTDAIRLFSGLRAVIVDEVHALAPTKRGADLSLSLERLQALTGGPVQRIGLSATAGPLEVAARFLVGERRSCIVGAAGESTQLELTFRHLEGDSSFLRQLVTSLEPELRANRATLLFANARGLAERLGRALRYAMPDWDALIAVHHSSLAPERRSEIEVAFKRGELRAIVSSTSLELGIDIGTVDLVVLVHSTRDVVRLLQRVGRSGHGPGRLKRGLVFTASPAELMEAAVTGAAGRSAQIEPLRLAAPPLDVLCQQLLGMACQSRCSSDAAFEFVRRAAPYRDLDRRDFDDCLAYLLGRDRTGQSWLPARLKGDPDSFSIRDASLARLLRRNLGSILAEETTAVALLSCDEERGQANDRPNSVDPSLPAPYFPLGEVDQRFAEHLQPGDRFLLDGRCLELRRLETGKLLVEEVPGRPAVPRWQGDGWPLSLNLAQRLFQLRVRAAEALRDGPAALAQMLRDEYGLLGNEAEVLVDYFERQEASSEIPDGDSVLVEMIGNSIAAELYVHTPLNRPANDALARVAVHRLARDHDRPAHSVVADLGFALLIRGDVTKAPHLLRRLLASQDFTEDLDAALAESPALRERFRCVATTGMMLLRYPIGGQRKVGGRSWGERQLFDRVRNHDPDFVLLRQAVREANAELCDTAAALSFAEALPRWPLKCRRLSQPSPFAEAWTQSVPGATEDTATPAEALRRLHAVLTGIGETHARTE